MLGKTQTQEQADKMAVKGLLEEGGALNCWLPALIKTPVTVTAVLICAVPFPFQFLALVLFHLALVMEIQCSFLTQVEHLSVPQHG